MGGGVEIIVKCKVNSDCMHCPSANELYTCADMYSPPSLFLIRFPASFLLYPPLPHLSHPCSIYHA